MMSLFWLVLEERLSVGLPLLFCLVGAGVASVVYWSFTDDLRFYTLVQFYPILCILLLFIMRPEGYIEQRRILQVISWFLAAKLPEACDKVRSFQSGSFTGVT